MSERISIVCGALIAAAVGATAAAAGQSANSGEPIAMTRAQGPIAIDGDLSDAGWRNAARVERWYEINPGDNTEPKVRNVGYLTYDDKFFYAAFEFDDPNPMAIRAPLGDHDAMPGYTHYAGIILDTRNDGHTASMFLVSRRGFAPTTRSPRAALLRVIGQYVSTDRDPSLYLQPTAAYDGRFSGSVLFAYKINWQSVMLSATAMTVSSTEPRRLVKSGRQVFVKMSYAFQR